jgi:hypothetical protein
MCNYNLFRHADRAELLCAVPEVRPVPAFIAGPPWSFVGRLRDCANGSSGFDHRVAEESVHLNGFYLFQLLNASDLKLWTSEDAARRYGGEAPVCDTGRESKPSALQMPLS